MNQTQETDLFAKLECNSIEQCINNLKALQVGIVNTESMSTFEQLVKCKGIEEIVNFLKTLQTESKN